MSLVLTALENVPLIKAGDSISDLIVSTCSSNGVGINNSDIFVVAQKIISKAENRLFNLTQITPTLEAKNLASKVEKDPRLVELILRESQEVLRYRPGTIICQHRLGFICANAGIDHSNVSGEWGNPQDWYLLLPEDPDGSANQIRVEICETTGRDVGILIIDSHGRSWRNGIVGTSIGMAGVPGLVDLRGEKDLFGYSLRITQIAAADELAAAASILMGQAAEGRPLVHVRGYPYKLRDSSIKELIRPKDRDLFR